MHVWVLKTAPLPFEVGLLLFCCNRRYGIDSPKEFEVIVTKHGKHSQPDPSAWHGTRWRSPILTKQQASSFSAMELAPFLERVHSGEQPEYLRSAPPPPPPEKYSGIGPKQLKKATVLTAKTFKKVVDHPKKDVLVFFHTATLQDYKMIPAVDALAWLFENHTNVVITKLNGEPLPLQVPPSAPPA